MVDILDPANSASVPLSDAPPSEPAPAPSDNLIISPAGQAPLTDLPTQSAGPSFGPSGSSPIPAVVPSPEPVAPVFNTTSASVSPIPSVSPFTAPQQSGTPGAPVGTAPNLSPPLPGGADDMKPKKKGMGAGLIIGLLLLLITLPIGVYYISQQQSLNDVRNRAASTDSGTGGGLYGGATRTPTINPNPTISASCPAITTCSCGKVCNNVIAKPPFNSSCPVWCANPYATVAPTPTIKKDCTYCGSSTSSTYASCMATCTGSPLTGDKTCSITNGVDSCAQWGMRCHCQDGNACTKTACEPDTQNYTSCKNQGRSWCVNQGGYAHTCCVEGYTCGSSPGCYKTGTSTLTTATPRPTNPPGSTNTPTNTPTKTPTSTSTGTPTKTPTNTPTGTISITNTPSHTATNTPTGTIVITNTPTKTPTPTSPAACNNACTVNTDCPSGLVCSDSRCRNVSCLESATCVCQVVETPTNTPTPTTAIAYVGCDSACTVNTDCSSGLVCVDSKCRNAVCSEKTTCQCDVAQAPVPTTPVTGTGTTLLGAVIITVAGLLLLLGIAL